MKVAFINQPWNYAVPPVQTGSIAIWIYEVARRLAGTHDVIIYARKARGQKKIEWHEGVQHRYVTTISNSRLFTLFPGSYRLSRLLQRLRSELLFRNPKRPYFASSFYSLEYLLRIAWDLRAQQCDIVHVHNFSQFAPIIRFFNPRLKIVLHMHCQWLTQLDHPMVELRLSKVDVILACSQFITEKIRRTFPQFAQRCQTVYNGVDVNHFHDKNANGVAEKTGTKHLLFVGRLTPEKGLHILLDAFQIVVQRCPQVRLKIVGPEAPTAYEFIVAFNDNPRLSELARFYEGSYMAHLLGRVPSNLKGQVMFVGAVPHLHLNQHNQEADLFVNPSFYEGFPLSILEAMASGLPVVATSVAGVPEAVENGKTGLLVEPGDALALAEAILYLLEDHHLRVRMGKAARQRVENLFSWERVVEHLLGQYKSICSSVA